MDLYDSPVGEFVGDKPEPDMSGTPDVHVFDQAGITAVTADRIELNQSATLLTAGDKISMNESTSVVTLADEVEATGSSLFLVISNNIHGEYSAVFTPKTAMIFGAAMGAAVFTLSMLFRPWRRR